MWDTDYRILSELITDQARIKPEIGDYGNLQITLTETNESINYSISFQSVPENIFVFKSDEFPAPKTIFNDSKNECKRADYIIFVERRDEKYAIFLELKLGNDTNTSIIEQLKGSLGLFGYCRKIGQVFWSEEGFLENYRICFVAIKNIPSERIKKTKPRYDRNQPLCHTEDIAFAVANVPRKIVIFRHQSRIYFEQFFQKIIQD
ncbi:hypothetical protein [Spirulina subsalsa]|uniref:hypothetical protein n=1 Tax=Spirulina subsalsa TaxID=54311 RepID=UPI000317470C|nr:hypothetical protein [Spirulina subsalsa]